MNLPPPPLNTLLGIATALEAGQKGTGDHGGDATGGRTRSGGSSGGQAFNWREGG